MAYTKQNFKDGDVLTALQLIKIEDGIIAKQETSNLTTILDENSDDSHYPSAKATYTSLSNKADKDHEHSILDITDYVEPDIPSALSDLSDDETHRTVTDKEKEAWNAKSDFSGSYNDLTDQPTIPTVPTNVSEFANDKEYVTATELENKGYLTEHQDISGKINYTDIEDSLTSTNVDKPLSANQGRVLGDKIVAEIFRIDALYNIITDSLLTNGTTGLTYELYDDYAVCIGIGSATDSDIKIASMVKGKLVTSIKNDAFRGCSSITSVIIPNTITAIGDSAFQSCDSLISVTIPDSVTNMGHNVFAGCISLRDVYLTDIAAWCNISFGDDYSSPFYCAENLYLNGELITELVIPDGVTVIPARAFERCSNFRAITIPDSVTGIGIQAFAYPSNLRYVCLTDMAAWCNIEFGNSYSNPLHNGGFLYLNGKPATDIVIPDGVTAISDYAFYGCEMDSVMISDSVRSIGSHAFTNCRGLASIVIPNNVTSIGVYAFKGCDYLTSVTIGNGITHISEGVFEDCSIANIAIPDSVISIDALAFSGCSYLRNVTFGENSNLEEIVGSAFYGCTNLREMHLPSGVKSIGVYYGCSRLESIHIPIGVTEIGSYTFYGCTKLADVYYEGTEEDWAKINIGTDGNEALSTATIHFESEV